MFGVASKQPPLRLRHTACAANGNAILYSQISPDLSTWSNSGQTNVGFYVQRNPIIIPINPDGRIRLTSVEDGVWFDLDADGIPERVAWTDPQAAVAFLAIDRNRNGRIDDGSEFFGDHTLPGISNGFAALAEMAFQGVPQDQRDGLLDTEPLFGRLLRKRPQ
jgi:hypothetical protein